ncbi:MAG: Mut7-C RNAse domain-containing protein [Alphaproteobacteria bacterium]
MCDEMLLRLGRWLRAAGYDTAIAEGGAEDRALIARCAAENRVLLTRDRLLVARAEASVPVLLLAGDAIDEQARALAASLSIDWRRAPFTRCVIDNTVLETAPPEAVAEVPPRSRQAGGPVLRCPVCFRLYWPGGHVRRMRERLAAWTR